MKKADFVLLDTTDQANMLHRHGVYLGKLKSKDQTVVFFQLEGFYIGVHYSEYRKQIAAIYCYDTTDILDPFLTDIDIEELISQ